MKKLFVIFAVVFLIGGALLIQKVREHGLSARVKPTEIEAWIAEQARDLATPSSIKDLKNPLTETPMVLAEARDHFADHCAACHGNHGDGKTMYGKGMYPPPPNLSDEDTQELTDGEIMNIIKEGIRFTGMPGFGGTDDDNWPLVIFIRHLPKLTDYEAGLMNEVNSLDPKKESPHENH